MIFNNRVWMSWNQQSCVQFIYVTLQASQQELRRHFGFGWPLTILYFKDDQVYWLNRWDELRSLGFKMLDCFLLPGYKAYFFEKEFPAKSEQLEEAIATLCHRNLSALPDSELMEEYRRFLELYRSWYTLGWYAEPVQFCAESILEEELRYLSDRGIVDQETLVSAKVYLGTSTRLTYASDIEGDILRIVQLIFDAAMKEQIEIQPSQTNRGRLTIRPYESASSVIPTKSTELTVQEFYEEYVAKRGSFTSVRDAIVEHSAKYFWKSNNYFSTRVLSEVDVLSECIEKVKTGTQLELQDLIGRSRRRIEEKQYLRNQIFNALRPYYKSVAGILSQISDLKDIRKKVILQANHAIELFLDEVARRLGCKSADLRRLLPVEIEDCMREGIKPLRDEIERRGSAAVIFWGEHDTAPSKFSGNQAIQSSDGMNQYSSPKAWEMENSVIASGDVAEEFIQALNDKFFFVLDWGRGRDIAAIRGECVFIPSPVRGEKQIEEIEGVVRIVIDPRAAGDFNKGDILVAPSTTPDFVPIMNLASCIITDFGGWTSHAALVSRELGKACIIGTYHASQVLTSGQRVIVRVREGVVLPLENKRSFL